MHRRRLGVLAGLSGVTLILCIAPFLKGGDVASQQQASMRTQLGEVDLGTLETNHEYERSLSFASPCPHDVRVLACLADCGCLRVVSFRKHVPRRGRFEALVHVDTRALTGDLRKSVTFVSEGGAAYIVSIAGFIRSGLSLLPEVLALETTSGSDFAATWSVRLEHRLAAPPRLHVDGLPDWVDVSVQNPDGNAKDRSLGLVRLSGTAPLSLDGIDSWSARVSAHSAHTDEVLAETAGMFVLVERKVLHGSPLPVPFLPSRTGYLGSCRLARSDGLPVSHVALEGASGSAQVDLSGRLKITLDRMPADGRIMLRSGEELIALPCFVIGGTGDGDDE